MANPAIGGILSGLMQGYDYQNELFRQKKLDQEQRDERSFQRQRQVAADQRTQTEFDNTQADRSHMLARRPTLEAREDADYGLQNAIRTMQVQKGAHDIARMPVVDQQQDAEFALNQQAKRQSMAATGQRMRTEAMQQQLAQWGIDDKRLEREMRHTQRALGAGFNAYQMSGDPTPIAEAWNSTAAATGHRAVEALQRNRDGSFVLKMQGQDPVSIKDDQQLLSAMAGAVDPSTFIQSYYNGIAAQREAAEARAKNPKNFTELIRGDDDTLQSVDLGSGRVSVLRDQAGAPVRGTVAGKEREGTPTQIAAKFYQEQIKEGSKNADAARSTAEFMQRAYPNASGWWSPQEPARPVWADEQNQPPPRFAEPQARAQPRIVRTGTAADGSRVAQLDDGTVVRIK